MKVICAPDSFKESLSAAEAAEAMARGIRRAVPHAEVDRCPIADGGEGTVDAMLAATGGQSRVSTVCGPHFESIDALWGLLGHRSGEPLTAVIEMAAASGLALVPVEKRDPSLTSTFGTGQLIAAAFDADARRMIMGIGGSATNDGGCGMAAALGAQFYDAAGQPMDGPPPAGGALEKIARIDLGGLDPRVAGSRITVACDVRNPLTGPDGAAAIYGPQKGATPHQIEQLDRGLMHLARLIREQLGKEVQTMPGAGAAGGLGGGLVAFLDATLQPGIELVLSMLDFEQRAAGCDLCLTGEGRLDGQSLSGKACLGVAQACRKVGVDTVALVGSIGPDANRTLDAGLKAYHAIGEGLSVEESIHRAAALLEESAARVVEKLP